MADVDHRRKQKSDDNSEKSFSDSEVENDDLNVTPNSSKDTSDKIAVMKSGDCSEYESAEEVDKSPDQCYPVAAEGECKESLSELVDEEGGEEGIAEPEDVEGEFLNGENASDEEEEDDYVHEERQQGDGEECSPIDAEKELDFDEDRRNPQYIPKKGMFYEHDDRNNEDIKEKQEELPRDRKKKLWLDEGKWGHDRFREEEQFPKSRNELIEAYGYDIRNEDGPPRARRRRRYGRGPTKYDRNWEDVTAYGRERFKAAVRGPPRGRRAIGRFRGPHPRYRDRQDFNEENSRRNDDRAVTLETSNKVPPQEESTETKEVLRHEDFPALPTKASEETQPPELAETVRTITFENSNFSTRNSATDPVPPRRGKTPPFSNVHDRGSRRPDARGGRGAGRGDYRGRGRGGNHQRHISPRFMENKINNNLSSELEQLSLAAIHICEEEESNGEPASSNVTEMQLKGAGDCSGRPKRYSSLRQRSLPETTSYPPPLPQQPYYETGYQSAPYALAEPTPSSTQSQTATSATIMNPPPPYQTFTPPPYSDSYGLRMSVTPPPRLFPQVSVPQPILAAPPCITATPTIMNFAPPPPPPSGYPFTYQQFATPPPPAPAPPTEMFPAGITYYYPPTQQPPPLRQQQHKRPKAIPILPPPPEGSRKEKGGSEDNISSLQQSTVGVES